MTTINTQINYTYQFSDNSQGPSCVIIQAESSEAMTKLLSIAQAKLPLYGVRKLDVEKWIEIRYSKMFKNSRSIQMIPVKTQDCKAFFLFRLDGYEPCRRTLSAFERAVS